MSQLFRPAWILGSILALMLTPALAEKPPAGAQPLSQIIKKLEDQGYTINEVEYEDNEWEVEGYDQQDEEIEIEVNPMTGEIED